MNWFPFGRITLDDVLRTDYRGKVEGNRGWESSWDRRQRIVPWITVVVAELVKSEFTL